MGECLVGVTLWGGPFLVWMAGRGVVIGAPLLPHRERSPGSRRSGRDVVEDARRAASRCGLPVAWVFQFVFLR